MSEFHVYDTTLRDGAQQEGLNLSVQDKLAISRHLDDLGVGYLEGGWPGAIPKDTEFFRRARTELDLRHSSLVAFGATRRAGVAAADDLQVQALLDAGTEVITLVAKSDVRHVEKALRTTAEENLAMIRDTVAHLRAQDRRVFLDAEHFFDGYRHDAGYTVEVVRVAAQAGASMKKTESRLTRRPENGTRGAMPKVLAQSSATWSHTPASAAPNTTALTPTAGASSAVIAAAISGDSGSECETSWWWRR